MKKNRLSLAGLVLCLVSSHIFAGVALQTPSDHSALLFGPNDSSVYANTQYSSLGKTLSGDDFSSTGVTVGGTYNGWLSGFVGFSGGIYPNALVVSGFGIDGAFKSAQCNLTAVVMRQSDVVPVSIYGSVGFNRSEAGGDANDYLNLVYSNFSEYEETLSIGIGVGYELKVTDKSKVILTSTLQNNNQCVMVKEYSDTIYLNRDISSNQVTNYTSLLTGFTYVYTPEPKLSIFGKVGSQVSTSLSSSWTVSSGIAYKI